MACTDTNTHTDTHKPVRTHVCDKHTINKQLKLNGNKCVAPGHIAVGMEPKATGPWSESDSSHCGINAVMNQMTLY